MDRLVILNSNNSDTLGVPLKIIQLGINAVKNHSARCNPHPDGYVHNRYVLQITFNRMLKRNKTFFMLKHPLMDRRRICVIADDTSNPSKGLMRDQMIRSHLDRFHSHNMDYIQDIITTMELYAYFKTTKEKKKLRESYDLFLIERQSKRFIADHMGKVTIR